MTDTGSGRERSHFQPQPGADNAQKTSPTSTTASTQAAGPFAEPSDAPAPGQERVGESTLALGLQTSSVGVGPRPLAKVELPPPDGSLGAQKRRHHAQRWREAGEGPILLLELQLVRRARRRRRPPASLRKLWEGAEHEVLSLLNRSRRGGPRSNLSQACVPWVPHLPASRNGAQ